MTNKFKKQFVKSFLVLSLFAIGGATTHNIAHGDTFSAIDAANKSGQLNKQDRKDLENAIKSGQVVYDPNAKSGSRWSYVGNNLTQSDSDKTSRSDYSLSMLDDEQKAIIKQGQKNNQASNTGTALEGQKTANLPGKAVYSAEDIKDAAKRANEGKSQEGDDKILQYAKNKGNIEENADTGKYESTSNLASSNMWTLYSELLMEQKESKQGGSVLGKGDVSVDLSYSTINKRGNQIASKKGDPLEVNHKPGTALASTLATYSHYNYFSTVSGNTLAQGRDSFFSTLGRFIGGLVALLAAYIGQITNDIKNLFGNFLVNLNPYYIFWDNAKGITNDNPMVAIVSDFASKIGFSGENLKLIFSFIFIIITAIFCYRIMKNLSRDGVTKRGILNPTNAWFMKIVPVFVILPLLALCSGYVIVSVNQMDLPVNSAVATKYLINARNWASARNLSPSGGVDATVPYASKEDGFIDKSYAPQTLKGDATIKSINQNSYIWAKNNPGVTEEEISTDLIQSWISNSTFNVNTYAGDAVLSDSSGEGAKSSTAVTSYDASQLKKVVDKPYGKDNKDKADINNFEEYLWSVSQNPTDTQIDPNNYKADNITGADGMSFTNQSTALLLQSSFDGTKAHFYAYNISPTGTQASMKSLSTVKTEWRETTLVGTSVIGQISSWVGLVGGYASLVMINFSIVMILVDIGLFGALYAFIKNVIDTVLSGNAASAFGTFVYFFALIAVGVLSLTTPSLIYDFIVLLTSVINGKFDVESIGGLFEGIILVLLTWIFCVHNYKNGWGETGLGRIFKGILLMADQAASKIHQIIPKYDNHSAVKAPNYGNFSATGSLQYAKDKIDGGIDKTKYKIRNRGIYNNGSGSVGNPNEELIGAGAGFAAGAAGATVVDAASKHRSYGGSSVVPNTKPTSPTTQTPTASRVTGSNVAKVPSARDSFTKTPDGSKIGTSLPTEKPKLTTQTPSAKSSFSNNDSKLNQVRLARDVAKASRGDVKSARKVMDEVKQRVPMAENDQPVVKKPAIIPSRPSKADEVRNTRGQLNDFKSDK